jgi:hypothetical protein
MMGARFERYYPWVLAAIAGLAVLPPMPWMPTHRAVVTSFIAKLFAIAIGFLATSQSILISLKDSPGMKRMEADGYHEPFVNFLSSATSLSFALAVVSGAFSAADFGRPDNIHGYAEAFWSFLCVLTLLSYYRAVSLLPYVLRGTIPRCAKGPKTHIPFDPNKR